MNYIDYFMDSSKPLLRPRPVVVEEDYELVCDVFPEPGFRSYFFGYVISKLAQDLRTHGIRNFTDRESRPDFPSLTRFLSHIVIIGPETFRNDRRGAGGTYEGDTSGAGESASLALAALSEDEEGEESREEAGLESA